MSIKQSLKRKAVLGSLSGVLSLGILGIGEATDVFNDNVVEASEETVHVTQKGDTLYAIGETYGYTPESIANYNGMNVNDILHIGVNLHFPTDVATTTTNQSSVPVDDLEFLMAIVQQEGGYDYESSRWVTSVIFNRYNQNNHSSISSVIKEQGQFESYGAGHYVKHLGDISEQVYEGVMSVVNNGSVHDYTHFWADWYALANGRSGINVGGNVYFNW